MKVFVVTKSNDWGDEFGSSSETVKVFTSLDKAKEFCKNKNEEEFTRMRNSRFKNEYDWEEVEFEK